MVIHMPKPQPVAAGFWTFCDQTGDLRHVDAHAGSTVCTRWPLLDRWHRNLIERGVDWLLNAAGAGRERLDAALRVPYPGSRLDRLPAIQSAFWHRLLHGMSGGATAQLFLGDGQAGSFGGLAIDDSQDSTAVSGFSGGSGGHDDNTGARGAGPGGGSGSGRDTYNRGDVSSGGGGHGTAGGSGRKGAAGGPVVPAAYAVAALIATGTATQRWTAQNLAMGGGGGGARSSKAGGNAGNGIVRLSAGNLTESNSRTFTGYQPSASDRAGSGSGGGYYAIVAGSYSLANGVTITLTGAAGRGSSDRRGGDGGNGRVTIWHGDSVATGAGTLTNAELTTFQLLPSLPLGQVRVS